METRASRTTLRVVPEAPEMTFISKYCTPGPGAEEVSRTVQLQINWPLLQQVRLIHFGPVVADKDVL